VQSGRAQTPAQDTCDGPVYSVKELTRKAKIGQRDFPTWTQEARSHDVHGRVVLEAVLCYTGKVTDVQVIESLPDGMTEKVIEAARSTQFTPAEVDGHPASQKIQFEYSFNERGGFNRIAAKKAEGRPIRFIEIIGNRRLRDKEVLQLLQTRPGETFSEQRITNDLEVVLATGYFDPKNTRVDVEATTDGDVGVIFEVCEQPLIDEIRFEGLVGVAQQDVSEAWRAQEIDLHKGGVYNPVTVKAAMDVIRRLLALRGQPNTEIETRTDQENSTSLTLTFVINRKL